MILLIKVCCLIVTPSHRLRNSNSWVGCYLMMILIPRPGGPTLPRHIGAGHGSPKCWGQRMPNLRFVVFFTKQWFKQIYYFGVILGIWHHQDWCAWRVFTCKLSGECQARVWRNCLAVSGGAADNKPLHWPALGACCKFHCQSIKLPTVFGRSEEMWVSTPPILVGATVGSWGRWFVSKCLDCGRFEWWQWLTFSMGFFWLGWTIVVVHNPNQQQRLAVCGALARGLIPCHSKDQTPWRFNFTHTHCHSMTKPSPDQNYTHNFHNCHHSW